MNAQLKKGLIEFCVLAVLKEKDSYGYQIIKDISDFIPMTESTLYPLLRRLEIAGYLSVYMEEHNSRMRKYFHITGEGEVYLETFIKEKKQIIDVLNFIEGMNGV